MADPTRNEDDGQKARSDRLRRPTKSTTTAIARRPPLSARRCGPFPKALTPLRLSYSWPQHAPQLRQRRQNIPAPGRGAKFAGRQGWSFKGSPSVVDDTIGSDWDVADEMSKLHVSDSKENNALPQFTSRDHSVPHSATQLRQFHLLLRQMSLVTVLCSPTAIHVLHLLRQRRPTIPLAFLTPLHQSKSSMDPKATLQDDAADRSYSISSIEKPPFGPAPSMPLESSAEHYDYRNHSLPSHSSVNEDHGRLQIPTRDGCTSHASHHGHACYHAQAVPAPAHYAPGIDYRFAPPQGTYPAPPPGAYPPPMPQQLHMLAILTDMLPISTGRSITTRLDPAAIRDAAALLLQTYPHLGHVSGPVYGTPYSPSNFYTQADAYTPALAQALARQLQYDAPGYLRDGHGGPSANNRKLGLYKTELCRSWEEKGSCRYGPKCQFAHGEDEVRKVTRHPKYKTEICRTFWVSGSCPYGKRCCFIHTELPISGQALPGATPSPSNADASRSTNQPAPVVPPDGRARSLSTNSDPNDQPSSLLARISAKSRESTGGNNASTRPEVTSPTSATTVQAEQTFVPYGRHALGSLRVDTALEGTPAHAVSAFPFSANPAISTTRPSPGPATATGDYANRHFGDISSGLMSQRLAPMSPMTPVSVQNTHRYSLSGDASIPSLANRSPEARISGGSTPFNVNGTPGDGPPGRITPSAQPFHARSGSGQWVNQARHAPSPSFGSVSNGSANPNDLHNWSEVAVGPNLVNGPKGFDPKRGA
ncbi:Zinc finger C-x8-C-x5-C-x3-H type (and similar) [Rhizoctonia solani]|uniref:Zinc finger C-x8-C-x5-C-x3-H type (And similar) n=1 Tax=Rhizoctonia solani TaxID=456999 RepID=A0A8H7IJ10_9AGAM|nr:Zinc finger C-x8-C-x5-C-x3-H type (and similar) [Rhizoctonia solani]